MIQFKNTSFMIDVKNNIQKKNEKNEKLNVNKIPEHICYILLLFIY